MHRTLAVIRIKPECKEWYIAMHRDPWKELLEETKAAGFQNELIWYHDDYSIIYFETEEAYFTCEERLYATEISQKWESLMGERFETEPVFPEKIFDLTELLEK